MALQRRCRASTLAGVSGAEVEDLVGAAVQPGHDLGDRAGVARGLIDASTPDRLPAVAGLDRALSGFVMLALQRLKLTFRTSES